MSKRLTISVIVLLNFVIYISLGLPDSILGSAWPSMRQSYGMAADQVSYLTTVILLFSFLSSMLYTKISKYFTVAHVIFISMLLVIIGLFLMIITVNPVILFLTTPFLGIGQGAIDVTVNHFAAKHLPSALMSFLHGFYGMGVSLSAAILTFFLSTFASWRLAILAIAVIEVLILFLILLYRDQFAEREELIQVNEAVDKLSKDKTFTLQHLISPIFYFFYAIEGIVGVFLATYYVENFHVKPAQAAFYTTLFWLGLMFGRFLTGVLTRVMTDKQILFSHLILLLVTSMLLGLQPASYTTIIIFVFGLSLSPLYPLMMMLPNQLYPEVIAKRVISYNVGFCMLGILVFPLVFGEVFNRFSFAIFPILIFVIVIILLGLATIMLNQKKEY